MSQSPPVLIVGAGPAGLAAALCLLRNRIPVRIIDKAPYFHVGSRGAGVQPRTVEALRILGTSVLSEFQERCAPIPPMRSYKLPGGVEPLKTWDLLVKMEPSPSRPYTTAVELGQDVLEQIFRKEIAKYKCTVELSTTLLQIEKKPDHVVVQLAKRQGQEELQGTFKFRYVIGADGARGVVRKLLGLTFLGETRDTDEFVVGDVEVQNLDTGFWHLWGDANTTISLRPSGPERTQFAIFMLGHDLQKHQLTTPENFRSFFNHFTGRTDIQLGYFSWLSYFRPNMRMVNKFNDGRVFVVGGALHLKHTVITDANGRIHIDAAHVHSPTGGQGMNSSVQDSFNLAWKLALVIKGLSPISLLSTYTEERQPVIAEMLRQTSSIHTSAFTEDNKDYEKNAGWQRGLSLYMLDINYRWSSIVLDERNQEKHAPGYLMAHAYGGHEHSLCAGDRAPEAAGLIPTATSAGAVKETSIFSLLTATHHTFLIFSGNEFARTDKMIEESRVIPTGVMRIAVILKERQSRPFAADLTLIDRDNHAHKDYLVNDRSLTGFIIRPDGVIGAIIRGEKGVTKYFKKILYN